MHWRWLIAAAALAVLLPVATQAQEGQQLKIWGYTQVRYIDGQYLWDNTAKDTLFLRRARLTAEGSIDDKASFRLQFDAAPGNTVLTDGYIDVALQPDLSLRAGQFLVPFGYELKECG
jgi:hypothetical protein